jgi:hypothetical protein
MARRRRPYVITDKSRAAIRDDLLRLIPDHPDVIREVMRSLDIPNAELREAALAKMRKLAKEID